MSRYWKNQTLEINVLRNSRNRDFILIKNYIKKKNKYDALKLIASKKQAFFEEKLSETIGKPKNFNFSEIEILIFFFKLSGVSSDYA